MHDVARIVAVVGADVAGQREVGQAGQRLDADRVNRVIDLVRKEGVAKFAINIREESD